MKSLQGLGDEEQEAPFRGRYLTDISELLIEGLVRLCCAVVLIFPLNVQAQLHPETAVRKKKKIRKNVFAFIFRLGKLPLTHAAPVLRSGVPLPEEYASPWPSATICVRKRCWCLGIEILENIRPWLVDS